MKMNLAKLLLAVLILSPTFFFAQRGKDLSYTVTATNTIVNTYTYLTADATAGASAITVNSNTMSGGAFIGNLAAGDLVMIIQMQGATMDINTVPVTDWGGNYTKPNAYLWDFDWMLDIMKLAEWGKVTSYNNSGKYEQREVLSVSGANTITFNCPLTNSYTSSGHVQVIRVPRFNNLTLNAATSIVPPFWDGNSGGVVAVEVNGNSVLNAASKISASGRGFRGGAANNVGGGGACVIHTNPTGNGATQLGSFAQSEGGRKGEGIGGYITEYAAVFSDYGRGGPANGGGGGGYQNCGGGGGANIGSGIYTGKGVPTTTHPNAVWDLETAGFGGSASSGGGRGGYSVSNADQNATLIGPNNTAWCATTTSSDARKENGGFGGHPNIYDATRIFMGGGGGAGDQDQSQGGAGGIGGGIVFITCYGNISGTGSLEADGAVGQNTNPTGQVPSFGQKRGNDGAGGGGAGGSIYVKNNTAIPATISLIARGGAGGNHNITFSAPATTEASGPGGAGAGGNVTITSGTPVQTLTGGISGVTNSSQLSEFTVNGATNGAAGVSNPASSIFNITANNVTICSGSTATLTATVTGTLPGTLTWYSQQFGGPSIGTGATYTTPVLTATTTYYVGVCPGTFRVPVIVTVNPKPIISGIAVLTNPTCSTSGSITGLTVSGGSPAYSYSWNGTSTLGPDYTNIPAGTYTLTVTDLNGCTDTDGPHTLVGTGGPIINASGVTIQNQLCNGTLGSISGITATGTGLIYSWSNSGGSTLNATNLVAGSYTLTVTDGSGCISTAGPYTVSFIAGPTVNASGIIITPSTCGNANGAISGITATGSGLNYTWNAVASASTNLSGQNSGNYSLVITDVNGCSVSTGPHFIPTSAGPVISTIAINVINENCNQGNGSITGLTISGGSPAYSVIWTNTAQTTIDITNLSAGDYSVTVTDQNGCVATSGPYTIANLSGLVLTTSGVVIQDQNCNGTLGSITGITATGTSLTYSWSNGGGNALDASNLVAGSYTLTVTDGSGCLGTAGPYTVNFIGGPTVNASGIIITPATCGNANGAISGINATGSSLSFDWNGTAAFDPNLSNQLGGNYTLVITDANGCTVSSGPHIIPDLAGLTISSVSIVIVAENCGLTDGSISGLTINGGSPAYIISWTGTAQTTLDINNLTAGNYSLTVTDQNGCVANGGPYLVPNSGGLSLNETNVIVTNVLCNGTLGSITGITSTGTGLTYSWSNGGGSSLDATNLSAGTYTLTVTDGNGCSFISAPYTVNPLIPMVLDLDALWVTQTSCSVNTGTVTGILLYGGINPVFSWSNGATTLDLADLPFGTYTITASDDQGCFDDWIVYITQLNAPMIDLSLMVITSENCGQSNATVSNITAVGGFPAYSYEWNNDPLMTSPDLTGIPAGTYTLTVTDIAGCFDIEVITVAGTSNPVLNAVNIDVNQITCLDLGSISGITVTGSMPISYSWTNTSQTTLAISNLSAGSYSLTATDNFGCIVTYGPVDLLNPIPPVANFSWNPNVPSINENVSFTNTSIGTGLSSTWTILSQQFVTDDTQYTFPLDGQYVINLAIVDANGCIDTISQIITIFAELLVPNVITRNDDNVNESFYIQGLKPNSSLTILNRWGNVVFNTDNYQNDWNGTDLSGDELTSGVYTYLLKGSDERIEHGFVHLIR